MKNRGAKAEAGKRDREGTTLARGDKLGLEVDIMRKTTKSV